MSDLFLMSIRTLFIYFLILAIFRVMGKREIGELSVFDLVVNIMIAEIAVLAIDDTGMELYKSIIPMFLLMIVQILMARILLKSKKLRELVDGTPTIIINKGKIMEKAMRKQRYNFDDLLQQLREKDVSNITDVDYAILEPSGKLSVILNENKEQPLTLPLIIDGEIQQNHLKNIHKTESWLKQQLKERGYVDVTKISLCTYQQGEFYIDLIDL